jgi:hypothetical protein
MTKQEFKQKYFTDNFYWVNEKNYKQLQEIGIELGCVNPNKKPSIIEWHEGFKNLGFRTYEKNNNVTVFQKEAFLVHNQTATDFSEMLLAYVSILKPDGIDKKINELLSLTDDFVFPAYYSHANKKMWKISNVYTNANPETLVLCGLDEGIETAIDLAIEHISKAKDKFYGYYKTQIK